MERATSSTRLMVVAIVAAIVSGAAVDAPLYAQTPSKQLLDSQCGRTGPWSVTSVGDAIYWTNYSAGTVVVAPLIGGTAKAIAKGQLGICGITSDGKNLYWANSLDGRIMRMPIGGGDPVAVATGQKQPSAITIMGKTVVWMTAEGSKGSQINDGSVRAMDAGGGEAPGTVKCHVCPDYCTRYYYDKNGVLKEEKYICGWHSCPPCGA